MINTSFIPNIRKPALTFREIIEIVRYATERGYFEYPVEAWKFEPKDAPKYEFLKASKARRQEFLRKHPHYPKHNPMLINEHPDDLSPEEQLKMELKQMKKRKSSKVALAN